MTHCHKSEWMWKTAPHMAAILYEGSSTRLIVNLHLERCICIYKYIHGQERPTNTCIRKRMRTCTHAFLSIPFYSSPFTFSFTTTFTSRFAYTFTLHDVTWPYSSFHYIKSHCSKLYLQSHSRLHIHSASFNYMRLHCIALH